MGLSIIVPTLDEADGIATALTALAPLRERGVEIVVADGGSRDSTVERARPFADRVVTAPRGRGAPV
jgi:glycosyltransferase involved in cell wall biosynthesis